MKKLANRFNSKSKDDTKNKNNEDKIFVLVELNLVEKAKIKKTTEQLRSADPEERHQAFEDLVNIYNSNQLQNYFFNINLERAETKSKVSSIIDNYNNNTSDSNNLNNSTNIIEDKTIINLLEINYLNLSQLLLDKNEFSLESCINFFHLQLNYLLNKHLIVGLTNYYNLEDILLEEETNTSNNSNFNLFSIFKALVSSAYQILSDLEIKEKSKKIISHVFEIMLLSSYESDYQDLVINYFNTELDSKSNKKIIINLQLIRMLLNEYGFEVFDFKRILSSAFKLSSNKNIGVKNELSELLVEFVLMYEIDERDSVLNRLEKKLEGEFYNVSFLILILLYNITLL